MNSDEPLHCPFCGETRLEIAERPYGPGYALTCQTCTGRIWGKTEAEVIEKWNRRHEKQ